MRIRMLVEKTGPRYDGRFWPPPGGEIDVPDEEGAGLCSQGDAAPVARLDEDVELRQAPAQAQVDIQATVETQGTESAPEPASEPEPVKPAPYAPKADWVNYAVAQGYSRDDAQAMTKADLTAALGD